MTVAAGRQQLYYYGARYYNPRIGSFLSVDPLSDKRPGLTPYNYVQNNPIMRIDPTGMLDTMPSAGAMIGGVIDGVKAVPRLFSQSIKELVPHLSTRGSGSTGNGGRQKGGMVLESSDGMSIVETQSKNAPSRTIDVEGLMLLISGIGPNMSKSGILMEGQKSTILEGPTAAANLYDQAGKGTKHIQGALKEDKKRETEGNQADSLINTTYEPNGQVIDHFVPITQKRNEE